jgi:hypothetical protein
MLARRFHKALVLACGFVLEACAFASTARIVKASSSVESAERAEAEKYAIYELTRAREYLHKAREEWGYSDYEAAERFASDAISWGDKARDKARDHDRPAPPPSAPPTPSAPAALPAAAPAEVPPPTAPLIAPEPSTAPPDDNTEAPAQNQPQGN